MNNSHLYTNYNEAMTHLELLFQSAADAPTGGKYVIKVQTDLEKIEMYLNYMLKVTGEGGKEKPEFMTSRILVAMTSEAEKREVYERAVAKGIPVMMTPDISELENKIPEDIYKHILRLYRVGRYESAREYICDAAKRQNNEYLNEYAGQIKELEKFKGHVITTHEVLIYNDLPAPKTFSTVIVDGDIIANSVLRGSERIAISDLKILQKTTKDERVIEKAKDLLTKLKTSDAISLPEFDYKYDFEDSEESPIIDVPQFCNAKHFLILKKSKEKYPKEDCVEFIPRFNFHNSKYIMLSATANEDICNAYFGKHSVNFQECAIAKYKDILKKCYNILMGVSYMYEILEMDEPAKKMIEAWNAISDKNISAVSGKSTKKRPGSSHSWFGNLVSIEHTNNQVLETIRTLGFSDCIYKSFDFHITGKAEHADTKVVKELPVIYNGHKFRFTTYEELWLQRIHIWETESAFEEDVRKLRLNGYDKDYFADAFGDLSLEQMN